MTGTNSGGVMRSNLMPNAALVLAILAALAFACAFGAAAGDPRLGANSLEFLARKRHFVGGFSTAGILLLLLAGWCAGMCRAYAANRSNLTMLLAIATIAFESWLYW